MVCQETCGDPGLFSVFLEEGKEQKLATGSDVLVRREKSGSVLSPPRSGGSARRAVGLQGGFGRSLRIVRHEPPAFADFPFVPSLGGAWLCQTGSVLRADAPQQRCLVSFHCSDACGLFSTMPSFSKAPAQGLGRGAGPLSWGCG